MSRLRSPIDYTAALAACDLCLLNLDKVRESPAIVQRETALLCALAQYRMIRAYALSRGKADRDALLATLELRRALRIAERQVILDKHGIRWTNVQA